VFRRTHRFAITVGLLGPANAVRVRFSIRC
jgi:hypothetical protein